MSYSELVKEIWSSVYEPSSDPSSVVNQYFHPDYQQCVNGAITNRDEFIAHVIEQKETMTVETIEYQHFIESDDEVFALYNPKGYGRDGETIEAEVIAYFKFKGQQLLNIHGQVRFIEGSVTSSK